VEGGQRKENPRSNEKVLLSHHASHTLTPQQFPPKITKCKYRSKPYHQKVRTHEHQLTLNVYASVVNTERRICRLGFSAFLCTFLVSTYLVDTLCQQKHLVLSVIWDVSIIKHKFSLSSGCQPFTGRTIVWNTVKHQLRSCSSVRLKCRLPTA
jgi:hypothetical protein